MRFFHAVIIGLGLMGCTATAQEPGHHPPALIEHHKETLPINPIEILSDTHGVNFEPYKAALLKTVKTNWYALIPLNARAPQNQKGKVAIELTVLKDGKVEGMKIAESSDDLRLDRAAWGGLTASEPFPPLPSDFSGPNIRMRFSFLYNPDKSELP